MPEAVVRNTTFLIFNGSMSFKGLSKAPWAAAQILFEIFCELGGVVIAYLPGNLAHTVVAVEQFLSRLLQPKITAPGF